MTRPQRGRFTVQLFSVQTKLRYLLLRAILSTILCTCHSGTSIIQFVEHIAMLWSQLDSSQFQKVSYCSFFHYFSKLRSVTFYLGDRKYDNSTALRKFKRQMYHASLTQILMPLRHGMTVPVVRRCPDSHYRRVIFDLAAFIADYPEQVYLSGVVQGWCPRLVILISRLNSG